MTPESPCGKGRWGTEFPTVAGARARARAAAQAQGAAANSGGSEPPKGVGRLHLPRLSVNTVTSVHSRPPFLPVPNLPAILRGEGVFPISQLRARTQKSAETSQGHSRSRKPGLLSPRLAPSHRQPPSARRRRERSRSRRLGRKGTEPPGPSPHGVRPGAWPAGPSAWRKGSPGPKGAHRLWASLWPLLPLRNAPCPSAEAQHPDPTPAPTPPGPWPC